LGGRDFEAEEVFLAERLIVAPQAGVFRLSRTAGPLPDGCEVRENQVLGTIERTWESFTVTSPHTGVLMGLLATPGERVRQSQPLAWLRLPT
jgi:biotin carboxyl carrier protein